MDDTDYMGLQTIFRMVKVSEIQATVLNSGSDDDSSGSNKAANSGCKRQDAAVDRLTSEPVGNHDRNERTTKPEAFNGEYDAYADPDANLDAYAEFTSRADAEMLVKTWARPLEEEAPEEPEHPLDFPEFIRFLEMSTEDAVQEYLNKWPEQCGPAVKDNKKLQQLMTTKGLQVFIPQSWEGIKGIVFDIRWKEGMPTHLKPKARPIHGRLVESVHKEFKRLCGEAGPPRRQLVYS